MAFADRLLLNKVDLVPREEDLQRVEARLRSINTFAPIQRCQHSTVDVNSVLGIQGRAAPLQEGPRCEGPRAPEATSSPGRRRRGPSPHSTVEAWSCAGASRLCGASPRVGFDLERTLAMDPEFLNAAGEHVHDDSVTSLGIRETRPVRQ